MILALTLAAAVAAMLAIAADSTARRHRSFYLLKPLTTLLIAGIAVAADGDAAYQRWVLAALMLSLVGDVCLMFGGNRWFVAGLASFLLAHVGFVLAFAQGVRAPDLPGWLAIVVFYAGALLFVLLPRAGRLKWPVLIYCLVLATMVFAGAARHESLADRGSLLALTGALAFMLSDSLLAWRRFVGPFRYAQASILSTYWVAVGLIAWSV